MPADFAGVDLLPVLVVAFEATAVGKAVDLQGVVGKLDLEIVVEEPDLEVIVEEADPEELAIPGILGATQ